MKWLIVTCCLLLPSAASALDLTLQQALERLEVDSEQWEAVDVRVARSRAFRREAMARLLPQLSASVSTTYNGQEVQFGDSVVRRQIDWGAGGVGRLTLFDASQYPLVAAAKRQIEVAEARGAWTRKSLQFEVASTFFQLAAAQRDVQISEQTVELRKAYVNRATALEEAGVALPLDVARATTQLLEAEQLQLEATARMGNSADSLAVLLGLPADGTIRAILDSPVPAPPESTSSVKNRDDLAAQRRNIESLDSVVDSRWWTLAPTLAVQGNVNAGPPSFSSPDVVTWSTTLSLSWLLYDGGARYARIDIANADATEAQLELSFAERQAAAELAAALRDWRAAYQALSVAERQVDVARQAYEMTTARFEAGLDTSIEVVEASDALFRAETSLSNARLAADIAAARSRYLAGEP